MASKKRNKKFKRIDGYIPETKTLKQKISELNIDELDNIGCADTRFKRLMIKFINFLRNEGFVISTDALLKFFELYNSFDIFALDDMKFTLKMLLCKNREQYMIFEEYFDMFFYGVTEIYSDSYFDEVKNALIKDKSQGLENEKSKKMEELENQKLIYQSQREEKEKEIEANKLKIEEDKQRFLSENRDYNLTYRRKKESNEDEVKDWLSSNNKELEEVINKTDLSEKSKINIRKLFSLSQDEILSMLKDNTETVFEDLKKSLNSVMMENILKDNNSDINNLCLVSSNILSKNKSFIDKKNKEFEKELNEFKNSIEKENQKLNEFDKLVKSNENKIKQEIKEVEKKINDVSIDIEKELVKKHRPVFTQGKNSVRVKTNMDLLGSDIEKLSDTQYETLTDIIKSNSSKFRTRLSRSMMRFKSKRFNYKKTMHKSLKTFGVPLELYFEKPKMKKTKIVCILDVSGSCAKSSKLLLRFIYELSGVFKGGVKSYVFVKDLADVSEYFLNSHINDAIEDSLKAVPRTYSDYYHALRTFNELYLGEIDKSTIVIFLGDARNNKNDSGVEYIANIKRKAKSVIWLNTEEIPKWNTNDSIIGLYSEYMNEVYEILTTNDLIKFLENFKIK